MVFVPFAQAAQHGRQLSPSVDTRQVDAARVGIRNNYVVTRELIEILLVFHVRRCEDARLKVCDQRFSITMQVPHAVNPNDESLLSLTHGREGMQANQRHDRKQWALLLQTPERAFDLVW